MKRVISIFAISGIFAFRAYAQCDLTVTDVFPLEYQAPGTHNFSFSIKELNQVGIGDFYVYWQFGSGSVQSFYVSAGSVPTGEVSDPTFMLTFPTAGNYILKLWVKSVTQTDMNPSNDTITKIIKVLSSLPTKNVVLEVFKHLDCCPCYYAAWYEDSVVSLNSKYAIANVYCGPGDAIYNADGETANNVYYYGHPMPFLDRYKFAYLPTLAADFFGLNNGYFLTAYKEREQYYEPVKVSFSSVNYNASTRELKVKLSAQFYDDLNGDYRFNLYLTEDSVKAYQGCAPDPNNYYHMHAVRQMAGGPWGMAGSLPAVINNGDVKEYEFDYTIPAAYNTDQMRLIGFVQTYTTDSFKRRILNSDQISFKDGLTLNTHTPTKLSDELNIYPNPARDKLAINFKNAANKNYRVDLYDLSGKRLLVSKKTGSTEIDLRPYANGNYFLKIDDGSEIFSRIITKE